MDAELSLALLENLPNPALVKDADLRYLWINVAFEAMFGVRRADVIGQRDPEIFVGRQAAQCNGGDMRVLATGDIDHAEETIIAADGTDRDIITRKSRLTLSSGEHVLVGVLHDVTDVSQLNRELQDSQTRLETLAHEMRHLSMTDPLTAVWNRRGFADVVGALLTDGGSIAVLDLDHFKKVNDQWGHEVGDHALVHVASLIAEVLGPRDHVGRLGGEEFVIYLSSTNAASNSAAVELIRSRIDGNPLVASGGFVHLTASFGVAHAKPGADLTTLLSYADQALYRAKETGRNRIIDVGVDPMLVG